MWQFLKTGSMLLANAGQVKHFEVFECFQMKQHHDNQHLGKTKLAGTSPFSFGRDQLVPLPFFVTFAKIIKTNVQRSDIYGHEGAPELEIDNRLFQSDSLTSDSLSESPLFSYP